MLKDCSTYLQNFKEMVKLLDLLRQNKKFDGFFTYKNNFGLIIENRNFVIFMGKKEK